VAQVNKEAYQQGAWRREPWPTRAYQQIDGLQVRAVARAGLPADR
jgi:hypothetical protein